MLSRVSQADPCLQCCSFKVLWDHWRSQSVFQFWLIYYGLPKRRLAASFRSHIHNVPYPFTAYTYLSRSTICAKRLPKDVCFFVHCRTVGGILPIGGSQDLLSWEKISFAKEKSGSRRLTHLRSTHQSVLISQT